MNSLGINFNLYSVQDMWSNVSNSLEEFTTNVVKPAITTINNSLRSFQTVAVIMQVSNIVLVRMGIDTMTQKICKNKPEDVFGTIKQKAFSAVVLAVWSNATHALASYCVGNPVTKVALVAITVASVVSTLGFYLGKIAYQEGVSYFKASKGEKVGSGTGNIGGGGDLSGEGSGFTDNSGPPVVD